MKEHDKRKKVICSRCNESKLNYGFNMCSSCLRRTKRETRPRFYLGTCFSEMSRRVRTFDPERPNYYKLNICNRDEFKDYFENDKEFLKLYKNWQKNNFERKHAPSIDRIDNTKGYIKGNMRFISHYENTSKDHRNKCWARKSNSQKIKSFKSQKDLAKYIGSHPSIVCNQFKLRQPILLKGYWIWRA